MYSRDLATSDIHLFGLLKKHLVGIRFAKEADLNKLVISWLQTLDTDFSYARI